MARENIGQNELAAQIGSLKGMLAEANSDYLAALVDENDTLMNLAGIQFVRMQAMATILAVDILASEPPAQTIYNGRELEGN